MWLVGIPFAVFFALFAAVAWSQIARMSSHRVRGVFDLMFALFDAFWLLGWSVGVFVLGALAVLFLFYRESARLTNGRLVHVPRLGPLKIVCQYDLARITNIRLEPAKNGQKVRIRFDYDGGSSGIGDAMPEPEARAIVERIRRAAHHPSFDSPVERGPQIDSGLGAVSPSADPNTTRPPSGLPTGMDGLTRSGAYRSGERHNPGDIRTSASGVVLIAANALPLIGVLVFNWRLSDVMVLYWAESAVIAFYTVLKICIVGKIAAVFAVPFFIGHFGAFMAGHFMFVYAFFVRGFDSTGPEPPVKDALLGIFVPLWPALVALVVSHGVSFVVNFVRAGEYEGERVSDLMSAPYKRIMVMHLTIILGGGIVLALKTTMPALIVLVLLKTAVDFRAHAREHASSRAVAPSLRASA
jgi:hypothetical protein